MKTLWIDQTIKYDGTQLRSLYAYLEHNLLGNSVIAFRGACDVNFDHMVDGEDLLQRAQICGSDMLHFIFEIFDEKLISGVLIQRLFASMAQNKILQKSKGQILLKRDGDDLYLDDRKLSISIAARSPQSILIHFAMNISNEGTPVKTCSLQDLKIEPV
ncbi:MAG: DUF366 family protein, partial [Bdellovibrionota bacterium]